MEGLVKLTQKMLREIIHYSPRMISRHVKFVNGFENLRYFHCIPRGTGFFLGDKDHARAIWRGMDDEWFLFDSFPKGCHPPEIWEFFADKVVHQLPYQHQSFNLATCAYHALNFLDFCTTHRYMRTGDMPDQYTRSLEDKWDENKWWQTDKDMVVVQNIEQMLREFPNCIPIRRPWNYDPHDKQLVQAFPPPPLKHLVPSPRRGITEVLVYNSNIKI